MRGKMKVQTNSNNSTNSTNSMDIVNETTTKSADIIEKLSRKLNEDLNYQKGSEPEYLERFAKKITYWSQLYTKIQQGYNKAEYQLNKKYTELFKFYLLESDLNLQKTEIQKFINADLSYRAIQNQLQECKIQLDFIERALKILDRQTWLIKNRLEYMKVLGLVDN